LRNADKSVCAVAEIRQLFKRKPSGYIEMAILDILDDGIALMKEAVQTSETFVNSYQTTLRYNPEDSPSS
jgi:hypothetical protein